MQIKLQGTAIACWAQQDITSGMAVKLEPALGKSNPDVVIGANLPGSDNTTEARYVAAWAVTNVKPPIYESLPTLDVGDSTQPYTLREFVAGSENLPATNVTLRMVPPRLKEQEVIPSGTLMLAYDQGIYEVTSGCVYGTSFAVGQDVSVKSDGKWYQSNSGTVAKVFEYKASTNKLTIKVGNIT